MPKKSKSSPDNDLVRLMNELKDLLTHRPRDIRKRIDIPKHLKVLMSSIIQILNVIYESNEEIEIPFDKELYKALLTHEEVVGLAVNIFFLMALIKPQFQLQFIHLGILPWISKFLQPTAPVAVRNDTTLLFITLGNNQANEPLFIEHGGVPMLLQLIQEDLATPKQQAIIGRLFALSTNFPCAARQLIRANVIQHLLALIPRVQTIVGVHILNLIESLHLHEEAIPMFGENEVKALLKCIQGSILQIETEAAIILANLMSFEPVMNLVEACEGIQTFISRLDAPSVSLQKAVTAALYHFTTLNDVYRETIAKAGAIPILSTFLLSPEICPFAIKALGSLAILADNAQAMVNSHRVVPTLFNLLRQGDIEIKAEVLNTLLQLVANDHRLRLSPLDIGTLFQLMDTEYPLTIRQRAALVLVQFQTPSIKSNFLKLDGVAILFSIISSEPNLALKSGALLELCQFLSEDNLEAKKQAEQLIELGLIPHLKELITSDHPRLCYCSAFCLTLLIFHNNHTPIALNEEQFKHLLALRLHQKIQVQEKNQLALLQLSHTVDNAKALSKAGGVPFLLESLMDPLHEEKAAAAIINLGAYLPEGLTFETRQQILPLLNFARNHDVKWLKRGALTCLHLSTDPKHGVLLYQASGHHFLIHLLKNAALAPIAREALDNLSKLSETFDRNIAIYEYVFNNTIHGAPPKFLEEKTESRVAVPPTSTKKVLKAQAKKAQHLQKIDELTAEILKLHHELGRAPVSFLTPANLCPRKRVLELQKMRDAIIKELEEHRLVQLKDASERAKAWVQQLYNGLPEAQGAAALNLLMMGRDVLLKQELYKTLDEKHLQRLIQNTDESLTAELTALFEILFGPYVAKIQDDDAPPSPRKCPMPAELHPEFPLILSIRTIVSPLFDGISPCLVGSQAERLQLGLSFDRTRDFDFEFICSSKSSINPGSIKEILMGKMLPPKTKFTHWNSFDSYHEIGFKIFPNIDLKLSIYTNRLPKFETCIQLSQIHRRLKHRGAIYDIDNQMIWAYDPQWRGFTNKEHSLTPEDFGYALFDLAVKKDEMRETLLNEPRFRKLFSSFFEKSDNVAQIHNQNFATAYAMKRLKNKFYASDEVPTIKAQRLIHLVLLDFGIDVPAHTFKESMHRFFSPRLTTSTDACRAFVDASRDVHKAPSPPTAPLS